MFSKLIRHYFLSLVFFILGLSVSLFAANYHVFPVLATSPVVSKTVEQLDRAVALEQQGQYFYTTNQFERAIKIWRQVEQIYADSENILSQTRVLSNLALAYSQESNWEQATANIIASLDLLKQAAEINSVEKTRTLAQVLNNQGILQLAQGQVEEAIVAWQDAMSNYKIVGDKLGVIRSLINQASAFKSLGLYRRALKTLAQVEEALAQQPDSIIKATGLRSYGDILRLVGNVEYSQQILEQSLAIASDLESPQDEAKTLFALGNTFRSALAYPKALEFYQQALVTCQDDLACVQTNLLLQINIAQLNLLLETESWERGGELISEIKSNLSDFAPNRVDINNQINFAHSLVELKSKALSQSQTIANMPSWSEIEQIIADAVNKARIIRDRRAESYALGLQGQVEEQLQRWNAASQTTQKALVLAQSINSPEISYLWHWQLGRISQAQQDRPKAISHYSQAIEILKSLSQDLVAIDPDIQYSFRESVEPVYRGLVSLLLETDGNAEVSQANLQGARDVIESLQLAELNNFFREACLDAQPVKIDRLDRHAAVIYPIILSDRLEVILSIPDQPLRHYSTPIARNRLEAIIEEFRQSIVIRSRREFYAPSQKLYNWLIRPALADLAANEIKTLVFVPDGSFRNIPLGALHDGKQYLIEQYSVALTPGLQLLAPRPLEQVSLKAIAAGLTEQRQGFTALDYVNLELEEIKETVSSIVLLDREFTTETLQREIKFSDSPIVHIATHGQFSSSLEDTFLLAWDSRISINELDKILQTRTPSQEQAIELLVLSACETATGDKWAALGLAGMAVRAGARSTLATLWSVNDRATAQLMGEFYQELSAKYLAKAEAVRQAQLKLLNSRWYKHPFYWAPYVLLGNWL